MLAAQDIFARINAQAASGGEGAAARPRGGECELGVSVSFFEIYGAPLLACVCLCSPWLFHSLSLSIYIGG